MCERVKYAEELFRKGYVCSQAVFAAYSELLGVDEDLALRIGNGFGGGVARMQEICGAVSGAVMLIGLKYGKTRADDREAHEKTYHIINRFCNEFINRNGSINCYELLGCDIATAKEKGLLSSVCKKCVKDAAQIIEQLLIEGEA